MLLIICKNHLHLKWTKNCEMSLNNNNSTEFKTTNAKLYVPIITTSTEDNVELIK